MNTPTKRCTKCGQEFPATTEYFYPLSNGKYGLYAECKTCRSLRMRAYHQANFSKIQVIQRAYRENNRTKIKAIMQAWRETHREKTRENFRKYSATHPEYAENKRARENLWRQNNRELVSTKNRRYRQSHIEKVRADERVRTHIRRVRINGAEGSHTADDIHDQYKRQKGRCYWCNVKVGNTYHVDHVIPLSRGGSNDPSNLVIACPDCNQSKSNKMPWEWPGNHGKML